MDTSETYIGEITDFRFYPIPLIKEEILSDYKYSEKGLTIRWCRDKDGKRTHHLLIDWNNHKLWVDGELYFDGKKKISHSIL